MVALAGLLACIPAVADYLAYAVGEKARLPLPETIDAIDAKYLINLEWGAYAGGRSPRGRPAGRQQERGFDAADGGR